MSLLIEKNKSNLVMLAIILVSLLAVKKVYDAHAYKCEQLKAEIKIEEDKASALERIVGINEKLKKLQESSWDTTNFEMVVQRVSELCAAAGFKIDSIMPSEKKSLDNYTTIPFLFKGEATYRELTKFLAGFEKNKKLLQLIDISLAPKHDSGSGAQDIVLTLSISGDALYFK